MGLSNKSNQFELKNFDIFMNSNYKTLLLDTFEK